MLPSFYTLHFGQIDAVQEAIDQPDLLTDGYFDYREAAYGVSSLRTWALLGPKGSGKSAVLKNLELSWQERYDRFFTNWNLGSFPVNDIIKIQTGQSLGGSRAQAAWEFLILLRVIESLDNDNSLSCDASFHKMCRGLRDGGYLSGNWLSKVAKWTSTKLKFDAKVVGAEANVDTDSITPLEVSSYLKKQISEMSTENVHIVALDGLDSFFFEAADEWNSLAGLVQAVYQLNTEFRSWKSPISVVIAIRSDIFDVLPGPEVNKMKPYSVYLDWHAHGIGSRNNLWKLLTAKASVHHPEVKDIVKQYMATPIGIGPHTDMAEYLLDNTRLIPRDAVALMGHLQRAYKGNKSITEHSAKNAVRSYAEEYFVGEIFDNIAGILPASKAVQLSSFKDVLRTVPSRVFTFEEVKNDLEGELSAAEIKALLRQMFETGGIGIINGKNTDFVFRKVSGAGFTVRYKFMLHDALTRAWNRPWRLESNRAKF
ncbi:hypothetical protein KN248_002495 [Mycobacterium paraintracellulare]|uniref:P-loop ATPase, Sll1717 family n=1 Tax=Mycobacterium paraintracellulare TaxID=1138383 RepID=UPI001915C9BB|nr:hypothetical protein [Mycobacterium paraintracellulare]WVL48997.1 hypothetical protein KN248_002495 [Mycobacterium paraintracellulare]